MLAHFKQETSLFVLRKQKKGSMWIPFEIWESRAVGPKGPKSPYFLTTF